MNDQPNSDDSAQYASVLASLTHGNEGCSDDSLQPHALDTEAFETEFVHMDDLTIVTSSGHVAGRLTSRILSGGLGAISNSKPEDLLQQHYVSDQSVSFRPSTFSQKLTKWKERRLLKKDSSIYPKMDDGTQNSMLNPLSSNNEVNNIILSVNKLPQQSTNNTAVEQPNIGPCSCFLCGQVLADPGERFTYLKSQKLFGMKISLLELLSNIVSQTVITDTESIDLCQRCSELMNEADITCKHLYDLREEINKLFTINKRPKLTFHILPKPPSLQSPKNFVLQNSSYVSLSDLAFSRPRRGRSKKPLAARNKKLDNGKREKRKGGRPRKPFQCQICRRKFFTQGLVDRHMFKEHNIFPSNTTTTSSESINSSVTFESSKPINYVEVKKENTEEDKVIEDNSYAYLSNEQTSPSSVTNSFLIENCGGIQSSVRPIQPKPETVVQTAGDGSLIYLMNPTTGEAAPSLIKISPGYLNLKTGNYTCELCQKTFLDDKGYKMHKIAAHGIRKKKPDSELCTNGRLSFIEDRKEGLQKLWQCDLCNLMYLSRKQLLDHKKQSHEFFFKDIELKEPKKDKLYPCSDCDQIFNYKYEMEKHKESHLPFHKVGPHEFLCCICGLKVASKAALKIHLHRFHTKDVETKDYLCAKCGYMTGTKKSFSDHLRVHADSPGPKKVCHLCKKEMLPSSFKIHMIRMHGEAKYPCEICGQRFTLRSVLMKHLNTIHSSLRPYDCVLCSEKFVTAEALRYHKNKVHSTVYHFCEICSKNFKWKGELKTHMNRMHSDERPRHQCLTCSKSYADRRKLQQHMINKHNASKMSTLIKKQNDDSSPKMDEMVSSSYDAPEHLLTPQSTVTTTVPCTTTYSSVHLITDDDNLASTLEYSNDRESSLTTLHAQLPLHDLDGDHTQVTTSLAHLSGDHTHVTSLAHLDGDHTRVTSLAHLDGDHVTSLAHYENTPIHVTSVSHDVLTHQNISSSILTHHPSKIHSHHQDVQSIYLVSDISLSTPDKTS